MSETVKLITIQEMVEKFGVGRDTIYRKYKPYLTQIPTTYNKVYFNEDSAITLHRKIMDEIALKKRNGQKGNFGKYKTV